MDQKMDAGWVPEGHEKENALDVDNNPVYLLPEPPATGSDGRRKRSWQLPLSQFGSGYSMMSGVEEEEEEESSSGEEMYSKTYTIRRGMEGYRPLPESSTFHDIDDDILHKDDEEVSTSKDEADNSPDHDNA